MASRLLTRSKALALAVSRADASSPSPIAGARCLRALSTLPRDPADPSPRQPAVGSLLGLFKNPLQGLTNSHPMSRLMQTEKQTDVIYRRFAGNEFTSGDRMGGNGFTGSDRMGGNEFRSGGRMGGNGFTGSGGSGRFRMDLMQPAGPRVKRDVFHITQKGKKTFVTVADVKGNRKAGASAGCLEDRKGRSRLARHAGEATGGHMGRSARKIGLKSVVVRVKGYSIFRKKKKIVLGFADGFRGERVRSQTPIMYIHDVTQLAHNGCRLPKKTRK